MLKCIDHILLIFVIDSLIQIDVRYVVRQVKFHINIIIGLCVGIRQTLKRVSVDDFKEI